MQKNKKGENKQRKWTHHHYPSLRCNSVTTQHPKFLMTWSDTSFTVFPRIFCKTRSQPPFAHEAASKLLGEWRWVGCGKGFQTNGTGRMESTAGQADQPPVAWNVCSWILSTFGHFPSGQSFPTFPTLSAPSPQGPLWTAWAVNYAGAPKPSMLLKSLDDGPWRRSGDLSWKMPDRKNVQKCAKNLYKGLETQCHRVPSELTEHVTLPSMWPKVSWATSLRHVHCLS